MTRREHRRSPWRSTAVAAFALVLTTVVGVAAHGTDVGMGESARTGQRVDTARPEFSDPTAITNPYFPIGLVTQVVQLGTEGGAPLRAEVTLLSDVRTITWDGRSVDALVSQYIAYGGGRILEVAYDYFAQADDGSVWYLGEDVDNFRRGRISDHEGTWLAGRHGPAGMIMPANPAEGDTYRPENIPGLVFEEVTVRSTSAPAEGPTGPIADALSVREHPMDGTVEDKLFARGYGEFRAQAPDELLTVAVAIPTDALPGEPPPELVAIGATAATVFEALSDGQWGEANRQVSELRDAWAGYQRGTQVPPLLADEMETALDALAASVAEHAAAPARQAAVGVIGATLDVRSRYEQAPPADLGRLGQWARQTILDAAAGRAADLRGDAAVLDAVWGRLPVTAIDPATARELQGSLDQLRVAAAGGRRAAVATAAKNVLTLAEALEGAS